MNYDNHPDANTPPMPVCRWCMHWFKSPGQVIMPDRGICLRANCVQGSDGERTMSDEGSKAHALTTVASSFGFRFAVNQLETSADFGCIQFKAR